MHLEIPHKFTQFEASARVKKALEEARPKLDGKAVIEEERWEGDTFNFSVLVEGQRITGVLEVQENSYVLDAKLPFLWRMFEGRIEKAIKEQVSTLM
jgi:phosphoribosylamine-glycine ligase